MKKESSQYIRTFANDGFTTSVGICVVAMIGNRSEALRRAVDEDRSEGRRECVGFCGPRDTRTGGKTKEFVIPELRRIKGEIRRSRNKMDQSGRAGRERSTGDHCRGSAGIVTFGIFRNTDTAKKATEINS
jgi:hypothetical protein